MTLLVIGKTGQLARALADVRPATVFLGRDTLDLSISPDRIAAALDAACPEDATGVILAAAYTKVDDAETETALADAVNGSAPGVIAQWCAQRGVPLVHLSTDYVFDGQGARPYRPGDPLSPVNAYGASKRVGEVSVLDSGAKAAILRTSWVYDSEGRNFLTTMLRLAETRDAVSVVDDQVGRPTYAADLAAACLSALDGLQDGKEGGVYHVTNTGPAISWADFAKAIFEKAGCDMVVNRIPSSDYPTPARRPAYSVLDTSGFEAAFGHALPDWKDGLARALAGRQKPAP